jgi:hypothetical protein
MSLLPKPNMNRQDRLLRLMIAMSMIAGAILTRSFLMGLGALFVLLELTLNWCVIYQFLGINRCPIRKR